MEIYARRLFTVDGAISAIRFLIAFYFIAAVVALNIASDGEGVFGLSLPSSPQTLAFLAAVALVCVAVMMGRMLRFAVVMLTAFAIWSCFYQPDASELQLSALLRFARDMTLVGAVFLVSHAIPSPRAQNKKEAVSAMDMAMDANLSHLPTRIRVAVPQRPGHESAKVSHLNLVRTRSTLRVPPAFAIKVSSEFEDEDQAQNSEGLDHVVAELARRRLGS